MSATKVSVPEKTTTEDAHPQFAKLMRLYKQVDDKIEDLKVQKKDSEDQLAHLKELIRSEVVNLGGAKGTKIVVEGVGNFHFTSQKHYKVPTGDERERLMRMLMDEKDGVALLTIGKKDLNSWCSDRKEAELDIPDFLDYFERTDIPVISLTKTPKAQGTQ